jgi:hypothetical protein
MHCSSLCLWLRPQGTARSRSGRRLAACQLDIPAHAHHATINVYTREAKASHVASLELKAEVEPVSYAPRIEPAHLQLHLALGSTPLCMQHRHQ